MTTCLPSICSDHRDPGTVRQVFRRDGSSFNVTVRERAGFNVTFSAPMSMSIAFANADAEGRQQILAAFRNQVSEDLVELEAFLGKPGMPIHLETHQQTARGEVHLHTHCLVGFVDVPDPRALYRWVGEMRRALHH